jgi:hypothetical protein
MEQVILMQLTNTRLGLVLGTVFSIALTMAREFSLLLKVNRPLLDHLK